MKSERMKVVGGRQKKNRTTSVKKPDIVTLLPAEYLDSEKSKAKFDLLKIHLESAATTYSVDSYLLNIAVVWLMIFDFYAEQMMDYVQNGGRNPFVLTHASGAEQVSTGYTMMNQATSQVQTCFKLLGIGPYSRSKIKEFLDQAQDKQDENDPFTKAANG